MRRISILVTIICTLSEIQTSSCFVLRGPLVVSPHISTDRLEDVNAKVKLSISTIAKCEGVGGCAMSNRALKRRSSTILSAAADKDMQEKDSQSGDVQGPSDANASPSASNENNESDKIENGSNRIVGFGDLGEFDPSKKIPIKREVLVGNPQQKVKKKEKNITDILQELAEIQQKGPRKYCILGTRHCSYLHQQIIELLSYALVLSENHVYTSGAGGTNAAAIKGALRAERPDLLTVILPQSLEKQADESQELLKDVTDLITMPQNDAMSLNVASRICNSKLLSETDQLIAFAFHESKTVIEATKEAKKLEMLVTMLFLD